MFFVWTLLHTPRTQISTETETHGSQQDTKQCMVQKKFSQRLAKIVVKEKEKAEHEKNQDEISFTEPISEFDRETKEWKRKRKKQKKRYLGSTSFRRQLVDQVQPFKYPGSKIGLWPFFTLQTDSMSKKAPHITFISTITRMFQSWFAGHVLNLSSELQVHSTKYGKIWFKTYRCLSVYCKIWLIEMSCS